MKSMSLANGDDVDPDIRMINPFAFFDTIQFFQRKNRLVFISVKGECREALVHTNVPEVGAGVFVRQKQVTKKMIDAFSKFAKKCPGFSPLL